MRGQRRASSRNDTGGRPLTTATLHADAIMNGVFAPPWLNCAVADEEAASAA